MMARALATVGFSPPSSSFAWKKKYARADGYFLFLMMYLFNNAAAQNTVVSTGWLEPLVGAQLTGGATWANPEHIQGNTTTTAAVSNLNGISNYLCAYSYTSDPKWIAAASGNSGGGRVVGFELRIFVSCTAGESCVERELRLRRTWDAVMGQSSDGKDSAVWSGQALTLKEHGAPSDLWNGAGPGWLPAGFAINDMTADFGVCLVVEKSGTGSKIDISVYSMLLNVYYESAVIATTATTATTATPATTGAVASSTQSSSALSSTSSTSTSSSSSSSTGSSPLGTASSSSFSLSTASASTVISSATGSGSPATETSTAASPEKSSPLFIILGVLGGVVCLCVVAAAAFFVKRRHSRVAPLEPSTTSEGEFSGTDDEAVITYGSVPDLAQLGGMSAEEFDDSDDDSVD